MKLLKKFWEKSSKKTDGKNQLDSSLFAMTSPKFHRKALERIFRMMGSVSGRRQASLVRPYIYIYTYIHIYICVRTCMYITHTTIQSLLSLVTHTIEEKGVGVEIGG